MKKLTSLILAAVSVVTIAAPAFADEPDYIDIPAQSAAVIEEDYYSQAAPDFFEETDAAEPDTAVAGPDADSEGDSILTDIPVAIMYLCVSGPHAHYAFGHTWICIKNISGKEITVGSSTIAPGEMISTGLHHDGGLHYNREMARYNGETVKAREKVLTISDLRTAEKEITNSRWHWYEYLGHNCTNYATSVWKKATGQGYFAFCFPFVVQIQMAISGTESVSINKY